MPSYPPPKLTVTLTCTQCGSTCYCGGGQCPSVSLPLPPDQKPMISCAYISVAVKSTATGFYIPGAG